MPTGAPDVGRYVKLHLMISDVGRWVGQRGSDVRSVIFEFLLFPFICRLKGHFQNLSFKFANSNLRINCTIFFKTNFLIEKIIGNCSVQKVYRGGIICRELNRWRLN